MEAEFSAEKRGRKPHRPIAVTVVALSIFTGLYNLKDGNLVQAMQ